MKKDMMKVVKMTAWFEGKEVVVDPLPEREVRTTSWWRYNFQRDVPTHHLLLNPKLTVVKYDGYYYGVRVEVGMVNANGKVKPGRRNLYRINRRFVTRADCEAEAAERRIYWADRKAAKEDNARRAEERKKQWELRRKGTMVCATQA